MKVAWVFPGQGDEHLGRLGALYRASSMIRETFTEADRLIDPPLTSLFRADENELLSRPLYSQLSLFTLSVALLRDLSQRGWTPDLVMGHSMGEVTALVASHAVSFETAFRFLRRRAEMMERIAPPGTGFMAAIHHLPVSRVRQLCLEAVRCGEVVQVAAINGDTQIVIAGTCGAVVRAQELARSMGGDVIPLAGILPVHCELMRPISDTLMEEFGRGWVSDPVIPFLSSVSGRAVTEGVAAEDLLHAQLHRPILWTETVRTAMLIGIDSVVEVGPGRTLLGLVKKIDRRVRRVQAEELLD